MTADEYIFYVSAGTMDDFSFIMEKLITLDDTGILEITNKTNYALIVDGEDAGHYSYILVDHDETRKRIINNISPSKREKAYFKPNYEMEVKTDSDVLFTYLDELMLKVSLMENVFVLKCPRGF